MSGDIIDQYLDSLFGQSEPGASLHHLYVATGQPSSPLGVVAASDLELTLYAIAPDESVKDTELFIGKTIAAAAVQAQNDGRRIHFAGLAIEALSVDFQSRKAREAARPMQEAGRLPEHPDAVETTRLYAACRDGRRWVGKHYLTGPRAGTKIGPLLRAGAIAPDERGSHQFLLRAMVGQ